MTTGIFIDITVDAERISPEIARALVAVCPVDIFALEQEQFVVNAEEQDECTLCELCLVTATAGAIVIRKLYKNEQLVSRGTSEA